MCMAIAFMKAAVVANQCPRSHDEPQNVVSLLQSQLQVNVPKVGGEGKALTSLLPAGAATQAAANQTMPWTAEVDKVATLAASLSPKSDKFTEHGYQTMYGIFLEPLAKAGSKAKLLEIGLGCNMMYGPGASVKVWQALLPNVELWEADFDVACVELARSRGQLKGVNTLTGDQGDKAVLAEWVAQSGGNFDVIIDDGGHQNTQIMASFDALWPAVKRGGLYFIEDLQVGRNSEFQEGYDTTGGSMVISDVVQAWVEQLLIPAPDAKSSALTWPLPVDVEFAMCQKQACVIGKSPAAKAGEGKFSA